MRAVPVTLLQCYNIYFSFAYSDNLISLLSQAQSLLDMGKLCQAISSTGNSARRTLKNHTGESGLACESVENLMSELRLDHNSIPISDRIGPVSDNNTFMVRQEKVANLLIIKVLTKNKN